MTTKILHAGKRFFTTFAFMEYITILFIAIGLAADAFAVALCFGATHLNNKKKTGLLLAISFGFFQGVMPLLGWLAGHYLKNSIEDFDHWIAFLLLLFIGGKMIWEGMKKLQSNTYNFEKLSVILLLSVATSIDALIAGMTLGLIDLPLLFSVVIIGVITFGLSLAGVHLGHKFYCILGKKAQLAGGIILIGIGVKVLIEHLG